MFSQWEWQTGVSPASSPLAVAVAVLGYLAVVWTLSQLIKQPVHVPKGVIVAHNLVLCLGSLAMFLGAAYEAIQVAAYCDALLLSALESSTALHRLLSSRN